VLLTVSVTRVTPSLVVDQTADVPSGAATVPQRHGQGVQGQVDAHGPGEPPWTSIRENTSIANAT